MEARLQRPTPLAAPRDEPLDEIATALRTPAHADEREG